MDEKSEQGTLSVARQPTVGDSVTINGQEFEFTTENRSVAGSTIPVAIGHFVSGSCVNLYFAIRESGAGVVDGLGCAKNTFRVSLACEPFSMLIEPKTPAQMATRHLRCQRKKK
uniref:Uncharacterized protein n=1 Tax=viral metagenome TaxID=1070528 RepID=A0A6M3J7U0_9ZZZZ